MRLGADIIAGLCLAVAIAGPSLAAETTEVEKKLAYVAAVGPDRTYYCRVVPRSDATNRTQMVIDFSLEGEGPVDARMVVTGSVGGRPYSARIYWRGTAGPAGEDGNDAQIVLNEVSGFDADPLPGEARWSDPTGDTITLRVDHHTSLGPQSYVLQGTQESEFGINDLTCLDGVRR